MKAYVLWVYAVVCTLVLGVRLILQFMGIDHTTGFYLAGSGLPTAFYILLAASVAALLFWPAYTRQKDYPTDTRLVCGVQIFMGFVVEVVAFNGIIQMLFGQQGTLPVLELASQLLSVAAGLSFVFSGFSGLAGNSKQESGLAGALLPVVWMCVLLLSTFMGYSLIATISDNLLHVLALTAALIFFTSRAKLMLGGAKPTTYARTVATGLLASLLCFVLAIPRIAVGMSGVTFSWGPAVEQGFVVLAIGIYALVVAIRLAFYKQPAQAEAL